MKINAKSVAALDLPTGKSDAIYFDDELAGFGYRLRLGAGGKVRRSWIAQYRHAGATRRVLLGAGEVLTAEMAKAAAKKILAKVALGEDPQAVKTDRRGRDKLSLKSVIDEYLLAKELDVRRSTFLEVRRYLTGPHFRALHGVPVDKVTRKDIASQLVTMARQRGKATAGLARGTLSAFFVWAMGQGIVEANPVIGTNKPTEAKPRERVLTDDELAAIWRECKDDAYGRIVRLLMLTGARRGEIGGMCWSEIDLDHGTWTLPAERSKNHRQHVLPILPMMAAILDGALHMASRDQLFGSRGDGFSHWAASKKLLDERSGVTAWTVHDIRRSVATKMADLGTQPHIIEAVLNYQSGHRAGVAGIYNRSNYEREVKIALAQWHDHVRTVIDGGERKVLTFTPQSVS